MTYQVRFRKTGGGIGRITLFWPETFPATDNPETSGVVELSQLPLTRLRAVTLPVNASESPIYTLATRVSPIHPTARRDTSNRYVWLHQCGGAYPGGGSGG